MMMRTKGSNPVNSLSNRTYRRVYGAQVTSLAGTGQSTVALALLAFDLAGDRAGAVLGMALASGEPGSEIQAQMAVRTVARLLKRWRLSVRQPIP